MTDLRREYVEQIGRGCSLSPELAAAFAAVPREAFVPEGFQRRDGIWAKPGDRDFLALVYRDDVLVTKLRGRTPVSSSSQPSLMAIMIMALDVRPGLRILEIGAGTGYNAALLASLGATVTSVDVQPDVADRARAALARAGIGGVRVVHGDGYAGAPGAVFDRVIVTVGVAGVSPHWLDQLTPGSVVIAPIEHAGTHPVLAVRQTTRTGSPTQAAWDLNPPGGNDSTKIPVDSDLEIGSPEHPGAPPDSGRARAEPAGTDLRPEGAVGVQPRGTGAGLRRVTAGVVCAAGFMTAAGPLTADRPGAHPAPAQAKTLAEFAQVAPPRFDPALDSLGYRDLSYAAGVWNRRTSHAAIPGYEQSCLILLDEARTGGAVILPDGTVLAGGAEATRYATEAIAIVDRWSAAGRPPMQGWRVALGLAGDPEAPIWVPESWSLR
jgi:protein-L-isoaspartate(D-aspartate) O-methyltransferase